MARKNAQYEEICGWSWWIHSLVLLCCLAAFSPLLDFLKEGVSFGPEGSNPWVLVLFIALGLGIPGLLYGLFGQLRTRVTHEGVEMAWGWTELIRKKIVFEEIRKAEAVTYSPIREFGGWGIRMGGGKKRAWTIRGNGAVRLHLADETLFYLGSDRPERLLLHLQSAAKGKAAGAGGETGGSEGG